jgi:hypothetical protein
MATPWPQVAAWPNDLREHAIYLSDYLKKALVCIESAEDQPVPKPLDLSGKARYSSARDTTDSAD